MLRNLVNIGPNSLKRRNFGVMAGKVAVRLKERRTAQENRAIKLWCAECGPVDLFHYDSDKSVEGRRYAWEAVKPHLSERAMSKTKSGHSGCLVSAENISG